MSIEQTQANLESVSGPMISPEALLWLEGKLSFEEYFAPIHARELAEARKRVDQELAERQAKLKLRFRDFLAAIWREIRTSS